MVQKKPLPKKLREFNERQLPTTLAECDLDFSNIDISAPEDKRSVCVFSKSSKDLSEIFGETDEIKPIEGGSLVIFPKKKQTSKAIAEHHGKKGMVVCQAFTPPLIPKGHNPDLFVIRNVPQEITVPMLWKALDADENQVSHISILPTPYRDVLILCENEEGRKQILNKNETLLENWIMKVELWYEFCARMVKKDVLCVGNLPEDTTVDSLRTLLNVPDVGIDYIQIASNNRFALIVCKTKSALDLIVSFGTEELKFSLVKNVCFSNAVYLNNLHETSNLSDIHNFLKGHDNIMKIDLRLNQRTGRKRAVVYFETSEAAVKALKLHESTLKDLPVAVTRSEQSKLEDSNTVFLTNLHRGVKPIDLCLAFQDCGYIESVHVPSQKNIVELRESAFIRFRDAACAAAALSKKVKIRKFRLNVYRQDPLANKRKKRSGRPRKAREGPGPGKRARMAADE